MSSDLYWRPAPEPPADPPTLPEGLKKIIAQRFWGHDGSLNGQPVMVDRSSIDYFSGLADADVDGAQDVIDAILKHGRIELWIAN
jgi:hypothetical protein